jgi:arsenite oxidase small subunit
MDRRDFIRLCSSTMALAAAQPGLLAQAAQLPTLVTYPRVQLVDKQGKPVVAGKLEKERAYVFPFPFLATPCYLLRLDHSVAGQTLTTADGQDYSWPGGVGPENSIVAFLAICTHLLTHPSRKISFLNYHREKDELSGKERVISCCAHGSVFDPAHGAKVVTGPAPQPLTTIVLEHDAKTDGLYATGSLGANIFADFFHNFRRDLIDEYGRGQARREITGTSTLLPIEEYTRQVVYC